MPLAGKQRKSLKRCFTFYDYGERASFFNRHICKRVPHYRFSEIKSSATRPFDNIFEGQSSKQKPQRFGCQNRTLPKLVGNRSFSEIISFSPIIAFCLDNG